jgi:hypothetical protein
VVIGAEAQFVAKANKLSGSDHTTDRLSLDVAVDTTALHDMSVIIASLTLVAGSASQSHFPQFPGTF